ncbi:IS66 family transposase [Paucibacter sp. KCTC 42545]|uniref:IS66 family transposase n=1 Tax=Paucibacter sp. KCTC 42545 TaxID=1768242 RepID=UPI0009EBFD60
MDALKTEMFSQCVRHSDGTSAALWKAGASKSHRSYLWSFCTGLIKDRPQTDPQHRRVPLRQACDEIPEVQSGALVCDDYSGYGALLAKRLLEVGFMAHARRKFYKLCANHRRRIRDFKPGRASPSV